MRQPALAAIACLMLTECATTTNNSNSPGCTAYGEARLTLPTMDDLQRALPLDRSRPRPPYD